MAGAISGAGLVTGVKKLLSNSSNSIFNGILIVLTISGESAFNALAFTCPCAYPQNILYGGAFLFTPAISLFFVGILLNNATFKLVHGCIYRHPSTKHGFRRSMYYWVLILAQAAVAPLAWLFVGFLNGEYYTCFHAGEAEACKIPYFSNSTLIKKLEVFHLKEKLHSELGPKVAGKITAGGQIDPNCICNLPELERKRLQATSQIIAWYILLLSTGFALLVHCVSGCVDRFTYRQNYFINLYRAMEEVKFEEVAKERAAQIALNNCNQFFDKTGRTKIDWDRISKVPLNDYPHFLTRNALGDKFEPNFTPLDTWCHGPQGCEYKQPTGKQNHKELESLIPIAEEENFTDR